MIKLLIESGVTIFTNNDLELVNRIKEKICFVSSDFEKDVKEFGRS